MPSGRNQVWPSIRPRTYPASRSPGPEENLGKRGNAGRPVSGWSWDAGNDRNHAQNSHGREGIRTLLPQKTAASTSWCSLRDRKSVVSGKGVSVRVDLGGRRVIKKKIIEQHKELRAYTDVHKTNSGGKEHIQNKY